jgi:hypothetical protein
MAFAGEDACSQQLRWDKLAFGGICWLNLHAFDIPTLPPPTSAFIGGFPFCFVSDEAF